MKEEECVNIFANIPDFVVFIFWVFLTVLMLAIILVIIFGGLGALLDWYHEKRGDYLRNKRVKLEIERMEKQKNADIKST